MARHKLTPAVIDAAMQRWRTQASLEPEMAGYIMEESEAQLLHEEVRQAFVSDGSGYQLCRAASPGFLRVHSAAL